jgi:hypothetical protein
MSIFDTFDRTGSVELPFRTDVVFRALEEAVGNLEGMRIADANAIAGHLFVKTSASAFSWGEKVSISVFEAGPTRSRVQVDSAAKTILGSATTHGKNRKNIEKIIAAASRILEQHGGDSSLDPAANVEERLRRLSDLQSKGLVTDEEYAERRAEILKEV